jgi:hypothetical protein
MISADLAAALVNDLPPDVRSILKSHFFDGESSFQNPASLQIETPGSGSDADGVARSRRSGQLPCCRMVRPSEQEVVVVGVAPVHLSNILLAFS